MSELERDLRQLGGAVAYPPTPDIAGTVARALTPSTRKPRPRRARAWRVWATVAVALVVLALGATMAVPPARTSVLRFLHIGAVHVRFVDRLPTVEKQAMAPPGTRIEEGASPQPLLRSPLLGRPDAIYAEENSVSQVFGDPDDVRLLVTQIRFSGFTPNAAKKLAGSDTHVDFVTVRGATEPGLWIEGAPHGVQFPGFPSRLAGNTLIWVRSDETTVRVEGKLRRDQALAVASSLR